MDKLHVMFPGSFKPFHSGHYQQIKKYLELPDYDVDVTIIISAADREGLKAETSKKFIDRVYRQNNKVSSVIAEAASPIKYMYELIDKGSGTYTMVSSTKGDDKKRVSDMISYYKKHPKEGISVVNTDVDYSPNVYQTRADDFMDKPISATIARNDVRNDDYESFKTSFTVMLDDGVIDEKAVKWYFKELSKQIMSTKESTLYDNKLVESYFNDIQYIPLNEGGMAGHLPHPYEVDEFTFADIKGMINDLFNAKIENMTEKLDGQNIFASVNKKGQTVFARNLTDIKGEGMSIKDMETKWADNPSVANAFVTGGKIIDEVFRKIKDRTLFFNRFRVANEYKIWVNCEIINPSNRNVIPYNDVHVYFHEVKSYAVKLEGKDTFEEITDPDNPGYENDMETIRNASDKAQHASVTNKIVMKQLSSNERVIVYFDNLLDNIMNLYEGLTAESKLRDWKSLALKSKLAKTDIGYIYQFDNLRKELENRWISNKKSTNIRDIKKLGFEAMTTGMKSGVVETMSKLEIKHKLDLISEYDKKIPEIMKKVLKPLDNFFIKLGNEAIKRCKGFSNEGSEMKIIFKLKEEIMKTIEKIKNSNDKEMVAKLNDQLRRLKETGDKINATEGLVLKYNGKTIKLTGSFAALNQILGLTRYSR